MDVRENLDHALKPRNLFAVTESISDSLTSSDSEDNLFTDSSATVHPNRNHMVRDDRHRRGIRMGRRQSLTLPTTQSQNTEDMDTLPEAEFNPKSPVEVYNLSRLEVDIEEEMMQILN